MLATCRSDALIVQQKKQTVERATKLLLTGLEEVNSRYFQSNIVPNPLNLARSRQLFVRYLHENLGPLPKSNVSQPSAPTSLGHQLLQQIRSNNAKDKFTVIGSNFGKPQSAQGAQPKVWRR